MKKRLIFILVAVLILLGGYSTAWSFDSGSDGSDGEFNPTTNTELQLPPNGIFNYTSVNIPAGVTVTFTKNAANTPVYILARGDVTIDGTISVNGGDGNSITPGSGDTGGFDGGNGGTQNFTGGRGMGPGGGIPTAYINFGGGGGGFGENGGNVPTLSIGGGVSYGNTSIFPMIGGSGGAGGNGNSDYSAGAGGGGGGAILIASGSAVYLGTITVTGLIIANGGAGADSSGPGGGGGSGGAIKLMADTITGEGTISAAGGTGGTGGYTKNGGAGGYGRIRLEADTLTRNAGTTPIYTYSYPGPVFPANVPGLQITFIAGVDVPVDPTGSYGVPDITLPINTTNPVTIDLSASNIPVGTTVKVWVIPQFDESASSATTTLSGTDASSIASVSMDLSTNYPNVVMAETTFTIQTAMYYDGEKIEKVRVATTMGGKSDAVYITESGKEIPAGELMAKMIRR